eukprot:scaffold33497_cov42-Phaeocystis_antarctica.AAC.1
MSSAGPPPPPPPLIPGRAPLRQRRRRAGLRRGKGAGGYLRCAPEGARATRPVAAAGGPAWTQTLIYARGGASSARVYLALIVEREKTGRPGKRFA